MIKISLGEKIKELRILNDLKQEDFAKLFNVTGATVSRWENGKMLPDYILLIMIAKYFNVSTDYLLGVDTLESDNLLTKAE